MSSVVVAAQIESKEAINELNPIFPLARPCMIKIYVEAQLLKLQFLTGGEENI